MITPIDIRPPVVRFEQALPHDSFTLVMGDHRTSRLIYQDDETGEYIEVPNTPWNFTASLSADAALFYANRTERTAERIKAEAASAPYRLMDLPAFVAQAASLRAWANILAALPPDKPVPRSLVR